MLPNTIYKAIRAGRLKKSPDEVIVPAPASQAAKAAAPRNQSARRIADGEAPMGLATTRSMERVAAALGALEGAETRFERADDVPHSRELCALAALLTQ